MHSTIRNYISTELRKAYLQSSSKEEGIDLYYDNVGGKHLEEALDNMKTFGRIVLCGMISEYNATSPIAGPSNIYLTITKRLRLHPLKSYIERPGHEPHQKRVE